MVATSSAVVPPERCTGVNISDSTCVIRTLGRSWLSVMELSVIIDGHHEVLNTSRRMYMHTCLGVM